MHHLVFPEPGGPTISIPEPTGKPLWGSRCSCRASGLAKAPPECHWPTYWSSASRPHRCLSGFLTIGSTSASLGATSRATSPSSASHATATGSGDGGSSRSHAGAGSCDNGVRNLSSARGVLENNSAARSGAHSARSPTRGVPRCITASERYTSTFTYKGRHVRAVRG